MVFIFVPLADGALDLRVAGGGANKKRPSGRQGEVEGVFGAGGGGCRARFAAGAGLCVGALARRDHLHIELGLNMAVHSPRMAVAFTRAMRKVLPGRFFGVAMGNEPDLYDRGRTGDFGRLQLLQRECPEQFSHL